LKLSELVNNLLPLSLRLRSGLSRKQDQSREKIEKLLVLTLSPSEICQRIRLLGDDAMQVFALFPVIPSVEVENG